MRKLLFIVLAFTACLLFPEGGDGACIRQQAPSAAFSAGDMHADEWQCERTYNSDLNHQPRVLREAETYLPQSAYAECRTFLLILAQAISPPCLNPIDPAVRRKRCGRQTGS